MTRSIFAVLSLGIVVTVAACAPPATVAFNGHSVTIRTPTPQEKDKQAAAIEAQQICGQIGKSAQYASTTYVHDLNIQHLFLCI